MRLDFKGFELKSLDDSQGEGVFSGYASTWDKDLYDDVIVKGAFADTLQNDFQGSGAGIPIHWQHKDDKPTDIIGETLSAVEDEHGLLAHIIERTSIHRDADGVIRYDADGDAPAGEIAPGTPVSLNLWGFTPSFLPSLDEGLRTFFAEKLPENPMKGEYYLPFAVDALIKAGKATAKVLKTSARWYGVTYREDKPVITAAVSQMTADGEYPEDL